MADTTDALIRGVLRDESLTRGLGDEEGRMLAEWVADWAELLAGAARDSTDARVLVARLARRGKAIGRFVQLWNDPVPAGRPPSSPPPSGSAGRCRPTGSSRPT